MGVVILSNMWFTLLKSIFELILNLTKYFCNLNLTKQCHKTGMKWKRESALNTLYPEPILNSTQSNYIHIIDKIM